MENKILKVMSSLSGIQADSIGRSGNTGIIIVKNAVDDKAKQILDHYKITLYDNVTDEECSSILKNIKGEM